MKVIILGGFLGSGKTTLLLQLIEHLKTRSEKNIPVAVLENEIGSVDVDGQFVSEKGYTVTSMLSGCACCTSSGDLPIAIRKIKEDFDPDFIIVEASGLAVPQDMKDNIVQVLGMNVRICIIADALRWRRILHPMRVLLTQQLRGADIVCVNKVDAISTDDLAFIHETLDEFNQSAERLEISARLTLSDSIIPLIVGD